MRTHIIRFFLLLGLIFPALASAARKRPLFHHFCLLMTGLVFCLGALSTNVFALMGGAIQNEGIALGDVLGANGVTLEKGTAHEIS